MSFFSNIRRKPDPDKGTVLASGAVVPSKDRPLRLSGTSDNTIKDPVDNSSQDAELGFTNGRTGNDWTYPDWPRGRFDVDQSTGDRLQDIANTQLSEGPNPGRVPRGWNNRVQGKVGRGISGNPSGDDAPPITIAGDSAGGIGDMVWIPHTPTPRNTTVARPYLRTIDDSAAIPGVYVADATRR